MSSEYLGIDVGGSGIKAALVDVDAGEMLTERVRLDTPQPATPERVMETVTGIVDQFDYSGPIGVGFPAVIHDGVVETANNIDDGWIGKNVADVVAKATGRNVTTINDADGAALAEARFGSANGVDGMVLTITFGTGIGSGLLIDGNLVPNLELGQLELDGHAPAESYFSAKVRRAEGLDWDQWGARANRYLCHVDEVLNPDLFVIGGGIVKHWDSFSHTLDESLNLVRAEMGNNAGLVGAALAASPRRIR